MATSRSFALGGDSEQVDLIDVAALVFIPWIAGVIFGVWSFEISVFGGYNLMDPIWTVGGSDISAGLILVVFGFGWIVFTNEIFGGRSDYAPEEMALIAVGLLAPIAYVFIPAFESLVHWHDVMRLGFTVLVAFVATYVSYVE